MVRPVKEHTNVKLRQLLIEGDEKLRRLERAYSSSPSLGALVALMMERKRRDIYEIAASPLLMQDYENYVKLLKKGVTAAIKKLPSGKIPAQRPSRWSTTDVFGTINIDGKTRGIRVRSIHSQYTNFIIDLYAGPLPDEGKYDWTILHTNFTNPGTVVQFLSVERWGLRAVSLNDPSPGLYPRTFSVPSVIFRAGDVPFRDVDEIFAMALSDLTKRGRQ